MVRKSGPRISRDGTVSDHNVDEVSLQTREAQPRVLQPWIDYTDGDYAPSAGSKSLNLVDLWQMVMKHRRRVAFVFLLVFGAGLAWSYSRTPLFTSYATLKIEPQSPTILRVDDAASQTVADPLSYDYYKTQYALLQSRPLAARVIRELGLLSNPAFVSPQPDGKVNRIQATIFSTFRALLPAVTSSPDEELSLSPESAEEKSATSTSVKNGVHTRNIDRYIQMLEVKPIVGTRLVQIRVTSPDPELSQRIANAHATTFIRATLENRFELTHEAREFLSKKLNELRADVERADQALNQFRRDRGVVSLEGNENIGSERMVELNRRLTETRTKRIELESLYQITVKKDPQALALVVEDTLIKQLKADLAKIEAEYARLSSTYTSAHPRLRELATQMTEVHNRLDTEVTTVLRRIEADYANARRREEALQSEAGEQQRRVIDLKALEADYNFLKNESVSSRALYETVLKRLHETSIWNESAISNIDVSEPAEVPVTPSSPQRARDLLLAALAGLALSVGLVAFREYADSTVKTPDDVWNVSSLPMLGLVPQQEYIDENAHRYQQFVKYLPQGRILESARPNPEASQHLVVSQHTHSGLAEFYYNIRTSLLLSQEGNPAQVVLLTSAHPHEGKTLTTVNLAISLAQIGHSVVVVDADLRQGSCHTLLRRSNSYGLSHVLSGYLPLKDSIQETTVSGLSLIARGEVPANPTRLLGSFELKGVMANLREWFDFVLVDSPPAIALSDAPLLSQVCDGVLLVVRWQQTSVDAARRLVDRLDTVRANVLGVVLNGVDLGDPHYVDYRQYYRSLYAHAEEEAEKTK